MAASASSRHHGWCFTINNYDEADIRWTEKFDCNYLVAGREVGELGTPHLQGYLHLEHAKSLSGMKRIHPRAHWEPAVGTPLEASDYCKKEGSFLERGTLPRQGKRTDIDDIRKMVKAKRPMSEIVEEASSYQAVRFAEVYLSYQSPSVRPDVNATWYFGPSGSGKTFQAARRSDGHSTYYKPSGRWWNGYDQHNVVLWDDFRDDQAPGPDLYRLLDSLPFAVEIKGGYRSINAHTFLFTSIQPPWDFYPKEDPFQLVRRLDSIVYMGADDGAFATIENLFKSRFPQLFSPPLPGRPHWKTKLVHFKEQQ